MSSFADASRERLGRTDSWIQDKTGFKLWQVMAGVAVLVLVIVAIWYFTKDSMVATPSKNIGSVGTSNIVSAGNNAMWAHGSQAAGGHLEQAAGKTGAVHWLHQAPASAAVSATSAAEGLAASALMDVGSGPTLAQVRASCPAPSWDALEDMKMAQMVGSVDPAQA